MRERGAGGNELYNRVEASYSPFTTQVLAQPFGGKFKLPMIPPYDGQFEPNFYIQHYEKWMLMQRQPDARF